MPGRVFAGAGNAGSGGGLLESDDDGVSWAVRSTVPQFAGGDTPNVTGLPPSHPRSTGHLLAIDPQGTIYAATFSGGVKRSSDGGQTWTTLGLAGQHLRSIALDPDDANVVIVSSYEGGLFRTTDASGVGAFSAVAGAPTRVEELRFIGDDLYAAGANGLDVSHDAGLTWQALAAPPSAGALWTSIDGHQACGSTFVVAGSEAGGSDSVISSSDGGASWTPLASDQSAIHTTIADGSGDRWWLADQTGYMLGGDHYTSAMVADAGAATSGCGSSGLFVTGRSGIWRSLDDGGDWYPVVAGLGVTIDPALAADPSAAGRINIASSDWGFLVSLDGGVHVAQRRAGKQGFDVASDPTLPAGAALLATGNESANTAGELWSSPDPATTAWTSEGLGAAAGGRRPLAVAANLVGGKRVLLAAVDASGIWRREGGAAWTRVSATAMATKQSYSAASLVWPSGSSTAYLYDHRTGVWRSTDSGRTWTKIWSKKVSGKLVGYLAVDPARLKPALGRGGERCVPPGRRRLRHGGGRHAQGGACAVRRPARPSGDRARRLAAGGGAGLGLLPRGAASHGGRRRQLAGRLGSVLPRDRRVCDRSRGRPGRSGLRVHLRRRSPRRELKPLLEPVMCVGLVVEAVDLSVAGLAVEADRLGERAIRLQAHGAGTRRGRVLLQFAKQPAAKAQAARVRRHPHSL